MKQAYFTFILCFNVFCIVLSTLSSIPVSGLYAGSVIATLFLLLKDEHIKKIEFIVIALLYVNIFIMANNGVFYTGFDMPPLFGAGSNVYEQSILRNVDIFGVSYLVKRPTGISDNIHVSGLLNLMLCFWLAQKKRFFQFIIASTILILGLNFQITLVLIVWSYYHFRDRQINLKSILFMSIGTLLIFFAIDYLILSGGYLWMITNTIGDSFIGELRFYFNNFTLERVFFGIKSGTIEDPSIGGHIIPLTDFGLIGVPIQNGIFGIIAIFMLFLFWFKFSSKELGKFIFINLIGLMHYFSMISFPVIVIMSWFVRYSMIAKEYKAPSSMQQCYGIQKLKQQESQG